MYKGLKAFMEKYEKRVPLEGLQADQMLRVRPDAEGVLELVAGHEPWSFNTAAGRGIAPVGAPWPWLDRGRRPWHRAQLQLSGASPDTAPQPWS